MKKLLIFVVWITSSISLIASNVITYTANAKLPESTSVSPSGLLTDAFNVPIVSHEFDKNTHKGSITFSGEVTSINYHAFYCCLELIDITIPNSVSKIEAKAFDFCPKLSSINVNAANKHFISVDGVLFNHDKDTLIKYPTGKLRDNYTIPSSVTTIGEYAFFQCVIENYITIPNSVKTICDYAFSCCYELPSIFIPASVTKIGMRAFTQCSKLTSINVDAANYNYTSLKGVLFNHTIDTLFQYPIGNTRTSYTIPNSVAMIGDYAFLGCSGLTSVTIPNSVTTIGEDAFSSCSGLTSVTIPNSVTEIGDYAFNSCSGLTSVTIPNSVTTIGDGAFGWCEGLTSVTIPNSVAMIGDYAFLGCSGLTSINIPNSVSKINTHAFAYCDKLSSIIIGECLKTIDNYAFYGCSSLKTIKIPHTITKIGHNAFNKCTNLMVVILECLIPPTLGNNAFSNVDSCVFNIPCGTIDKYQSVWGMIFSFIENEEPPYYVNIQADYGTITYLVRYSCASDTAKILATADEHYNFSMWSDGNTENPRTIVITQDTTFIALFVPKQYKVSTSALENGTINGAGIYDYGTTITLTVLPEEHYHFVKWSDGNTQNPRHIMVSGDATYKAIIEIDQHKLTGIAENGTINGIGSYNYGSLITLTAVPNEHYYFEKWEDGVSTASRQVQLTQDTSFTAIFNPCSYTISTTAKNGSVVGGGTYAYNSSATLSVISNEHYHFVKWSDGNTNNPRHVKVEGDATYTAINEIDQHRVVANAVHGYVDGSGIYDYGSFVILTAQPDNGYRFVKWSNGNEYDPYVFVIEDDVTIDAIFELVTDALDEISAPTQPRKVMIGGNIFMQVNNDLYDIIGNKIK